MTIAVRLLLSMALTSALLGQWRAEAAVCGVFESHMGADFDFTQLNRYVNGSR
jgi:hypothetical protein